MISWIKFFLFLSLALLVELVWDAGIGRWIAPPNLIHLVAMGVALNAGPRRGALIGGFAGLVNDLLGIHPDGVETFAGLMLGALAGWGGRRILLETELSRFFAVGCLIVAISGVISLTHFGLVVARESSLIAQGYGIILRARPQFDSQGVVLAIFAWPVLARLIESIHLLDEDEGLPTAATRQTGRPIKR